MSVEAALDGWVGLVGGVSSVLLLLYLSFVIYYTVKKERRLEKIEQQLARIEGILIGGRRF